MAEVRHPEVTVQLSGEDGNVFAIMGRVRSSMKRAGVPAQEVAAFTHEVMAAHSYDEALQACMRWVDCA